MLDSPQHIRRWAQAMRQQVATEAMPPGNVSHITPQERALLVAWFEGRGK